MRTQPVKADQVVETFIVEEEGIVRLEHEDLHVCLAFSRKLSLKAKVRRKDGTLLAFRMREQLSPDELAVEQIRGTMDDET